MTRNGTPTPPPLPPHHSSSHPPPPPPIPPTSSPFGVWRHPPSFVSLHATTLAPLSATAVGAPTSTQFSHSPYFENISTRDYIFLQKPPSDKTCSMRSTHMYDNSPSLSIIGYFCKNMSCAHGACQEILLCMHHFPAALASSITSTGGSPSACSRSSKGARRSRRSAGRHQRAPSHEHHGRRRPGRPRGRDSRSARAEVHLHPDGCGLTPLLGRSAQGRPAGSLRKSRARQLFPHCGH